MQLHNLESLVKPRKRVGRGGSRGGTSGRGHKGQKARSGVGGELKGFFEGGQMSLTRRLPRRGFTNARFKKETAIFNLKDLDYYFNEGDRVTKESLHEKGALKGRSYDKIKILGKGSLTKKLVIDIDCLSSSATEAIEKAGGQVIKK